MFQRTVDDSILFCHYTYYLNELLSLLYSATSKYQLLILIPFQTSDTLENDLGQSCQK